MLDGLVEQAQRGDAEAFDSLARMVGDRYLAIAVRILRDVNLAEEAVQAALVTAWVDLQTAAHAVVDSGLAVRLVSLDGTNQVPVTPEYAERIRREANRAAALVVAELFGANPVMTDATYVPWDPLAAALAAGSPLGTFSPGRVDVEEAEGPQVGFTRPVEEPPNVEYLSAADREAAENALLQTLNR